MGNVSPVKAIADLTPVEFRFSSRDAINFQIVFYSDAAGLVPLDPSAGGVADLLFETQFAGYEGSSTDPTPANLPFSGWDPNGTSVATPGATLRGFGFGGGAGAVRITASNITPAAGGVAYRIHVPVTELS